MVEQPVAGYAKILRDIPIMQVRRLSPRLVALVSLLLVLSGCQTLVDTGVVERPTTEIRGLQLVNLSATDVDLAVEVQIDNPNAMGLKVNELDYRLQVNGQRLVSGNYAQGFSLAGRDRSTIMIPLRFALKDLSRLVESLKDQDEFVYQLDTTTSLDVVGLGSIPLTSSQQGRLPVPRLPVVRISNFQLQGLSMLRANLLVQFEVENPNSFAIMPKAFDYNLVVNNQTWAQGSFKSLPDLGGKSTQRIDLPVALSMAQMGMGIMGLLSGDKAALDYELTGAISFDTDIPSLQGLNIPLRMLGTMLAN